MMAALLLSLPSLHWQTCSQVGRGLHTCWALFDHSSGWRLYTFVNLQRTCLFGSLAVTSQGLGRYCLRLPIFLYGRGVSPGPARGCFTALLPSPWNQRGYLQRDRFHVFFWYTWGYANVRELTLYISMHVCGGGVEINPGFLCVGQILYCWAAPSNPLKYF